MVPACFSSFIYWTFYCIDWECCLNYMLRIKAGTFHLKKLPLLRIQNENVPLQGENLEFVTWKELTKYYYTSWVTDIFVYSSDILTWTNGKWVVSGWIHGAGGENRGKYCWPSSSGTIICKQTVPFQMCIMCTHTPQTGAAFYKCQQLFGNLHRKKTSPPTFFFNASTSSTHCWCRNPNWIYI